MLLTFLLLYLAVADLLQLLLLVRKALHDRVDRDNTRVMVKDGKECGSVGGHFEIDSLDPR